MKVENCVRTSQRCRVAVARYGPIVAAVSRNKPGASASWCIRSPVREDVVILAVHKVARWGCDGVGLCHSRPFFAKTMRASDDKSQCQSEERIREACARRRGFWASQRRGHPTKPSELTKGSCGVPSGGARVVLQRAHKPRFSVIYRRFSYYM